MPKICGKKKYSGYQGKHFEIMLNHKGTYMYKWNTEIIMERKNTIVPKIYITKIIDI